MKITTAENYPIEKLKALWKEVFGDTDEYISLFFSRKFRPENTFIIDENGLKSMAFYVEQKIENLSCAYICGVATEPKSRGKGYAAAIMEHMLKVIESRGFHLAFLIPATDSLFDFYKKQGFEIFSKLGRITLKRGEEKSFEPFETEFDYEKLNRFYTSYFKGARTERNALNFRDIYDCYKNLRIYKSGYIFYYTENNVLHIIEHTMPNIVPYANAVMADVGAQEAVVCDMNSNPAPFSMAYYFKSLSFDKPVYVNLMLN